MKLEDSKTLFEALADPTRLRILNLLQEGELCVCDIMSVLKEPQSKISRHLAYLRRAGVAEARKSGLWMYYRTSLSGGKTFRAIFTALRGAGADFAELEKDLREFKKLKSGLVSCCKA